MPKAIEFKQSILPCEKTISEKFQIIHLGEVIFLSSVKSFVMLVLTKKSSLKFVRASLHMAKILFQRFLSLRGFFLTGSQHFKSLTITAVKIYKYGQMKPSFGLFMKLD